MIWLQLQPRPDYPDHVDRQWQAEAVRRGVLCSECRQRLPATVGHVLDVRLLEAPHRRPFGPLGVCLIAQRAFVEALDLIGHDLLTDFAIGKVTLPDGRESEKLVTLSAKKLVAIRGGYQSGSRLHCRTCGRFLYFPMPWESRHLVKGTFDELRRLHATELSVLIVRKEIWSRIPDVFKKKIRAWPLPVKDKAEDGIEDFPPMWP